MTFADDGFYEGRAHLLSNANAARRLAAACGVRTQRLQLGPFLWAHWGVSHA